MIEGEKERLADEFLRETESYIEKCISVYRLARLPLIPLGEAMLHQAVMILVGSGGDEAVRYVLRKYSEQLSMPEPAGNA